MKHLHNFFAKRTPLVILVLLGFPLHATEDLTPEESIVLQDSSLMPESYPVEDTPLLAAIGPPPQGNGYPQPLNDSEVFPIDLLSALSLAGGSDLEIQFLRERLREAYADEKLAYVRYLPSVSIFGEFLKHEGRIQGTVGDLPRASLPRRTSPRSRGCAGVDPDFLGGARHAAAIGPLHHPRTHGRSGHADSVGRTRRFTEGTCANRAGRSTGASSGTLLAIGGANATRGRRQNFCQNSPGLPRLAVSEGMKGAA